MMSKRIIVFLLCMGWFLFSGAYAESVETPEADQQINDFSLAGYGEKGKKTWEIAGKSADILENSVKLQDVIGNLYNENEEITLTANRGDFDRKEGKVHLEEDVVITTSSGAQLTTDSLDWDRRNQVVSTQDPVNIVRENMVTTATGAVGEPGLNKVTLQKEVEVNIHPQEAQTEMNKIVIICDGPLEIDYAKNIATFRNNVKVDTQDNIMYSDIMEVFFLTSAEKETPAEAASDEMMGTRINKIVARGNVKIVKGENVSYSEEAVYTAVDKRIVLTGRPRLIIYSTSDLSSAFGQ